MVTDFPFSNFTVRLTNLRLPIDIHRWVKFFEQDFANVKAFHKGQADLQFSLCEVYKIHFDAPITIVGIDKFATTPFTATLFISDSLFYLLLQMGEGHHFMSASSRMLKNTPQLFNQLGGGRFLSTANNVFISFEEDEFNKYYLLSTTNKSMMEMDELFSFAREVLT